MGDHDEGPVKIAVDGRRFTFRVERGPALSFWIVECEGKVWRSPVAFTGQEKPGFFQSMARSAGGAPRALAGNNVEEAADLTA